jgi:hypothetical protein
MKPLDLTLCAAAGWCLMGLAAASAQPLPPPGQTDLTVVPKVSTAYTPKKTAWGDPDFRGTWPLDHLNGTSLQRDAKYGDRVYMNDQEYAARVKAEDAAQQRYANEEKSGKLGMGHWDEAGQANRRTSLIIDPANGRLPDYTPEGKQLSSEMRSSWRRGQSFDWVTDFDTWDRCITRGMPASMFPFHYNTGMRIFQSPGLVAMQMEMIHETRLIPTDGRPGIPVKLRNWIGESRGHWEGKNTLVIETGNFRTGPSATNSGTVGAPIANDVPLSEQARMTERITMTGPNTMEYEVTWNDPVVFSKPWTARLDWKRDDKYGMYEYACHEDDEQVRNFITSDRARRAQAQAKDQKGGAE